MAEVQPPSSESSPSVIPMKRAFEDDHTPAISSPLNPDSARSRVSRPNAREQREKKDSLKKRESAAIAQGSTTDAGKKKKGMDGNFREGDIIPVRHNHQLPKDAFAYAVRDPLFVPHEPTPFVTPDGTELKKPHEHAENKKNYRYTPCVADPLFKHSHYFRQSDGKPFGAHMSLEDSDKWFHFDEATANIITNEKGWRMARANVCVREGKFYYEVRIIRGVPREGSPTQLAANSTGPLPHIRMGWARREAPLDSPVGFDAYSYGMTDIRMEPMHKSRASRFLDDGTDNPATKKIAKPKATKSKGGHASLNGFQANDNAREGDVIGLEISLPSVILQRKVLDGSYNPAVDIGSGLDQPVMSPYSSQALEDDYGAPNVARDRFPIPWHKATYFETVEYRASKGMEGYGDRGPFSKEIPSLNHPDSSLRPLPHSSIKIWKNGKLVGTAFRNLMSFLPPASAPEASTVKGVRTGLDDGMLGYYPAVGIFNGAIAEVNFGPHFWFPPLESPSIPVEESKPANESPDTEITNHDLHTSAITEEALVLAGIDRPLNRSRPASDRWKEQIVEDIMYDLVDEADFFIQDGGDIMINL